MKKAVVIKEIDRSPNLKAQLYKLSLIIYNETMVKVVTKKNLHSDDKDDKTYWLSKSPDERWQAVEILRRQYYGEYPQRLQRVYRIIKRK